METVSVVLLVVFAVIGVIALIREISFYLLRYKTNESVMFVTPISGKCEDAEMILRSAASKVAHTPRRRSARSRSAAPWRFVVNPDTPSVGSAFFSCSAKRAPGQYAPT